MRTLVAVLLILAMPLCAQAGNRWRDNRGAPAPAYQGGGRPPYGPPHGGGYPPPPHGGYPPPHGGYRPPPPPPYGGPPPGPIYGGPPPRSQQQHARDEMRAGRRVPLPMVIERLRRTNGGEYVDTREVTDPSGRPLYVLRFRQHGRYVDVPVDAETGVVQR